MLDIVLLAALALGGCFVISHPRTFEDTYYAEKFDPDENPFAPTDWDTTPMPVIEGRSAEPHAIPWDDIGDGQFQGQPLPNANRSILVNRPLIWREKAEVEQEPPHVERDPLYPDDLRAYDVLRSRQQEVLYDSHKRNFQFGGYHIPYLAENKTRQEAAQSETLSGRQINEYTNGGQNRNGPIFNLKDSSVNAVRRRADHVIDDRPSTDATWTQVDGAEGYTDGPGGLPLPIRKQVNEFITTIQQEAAVQEAAIHQPQEWILPVTSRTFPKYHNSADIEQSFVELTSNELSARDNRGEIADTNPMKKKRLIIFGDEGVRTDQVAKIGGYLIDNDALTYAPTGRRYDNHPEVSNGGLYQVGSDRTFLDANRGIDTGVGKSTGEYLRNRIVNVNPLYALPHIIGEDFTDWSPYINDVETSFRSSMTTGEYPQWLAQASQWDATEENHTLETPLVR